MRNLAVLLILVLAPGLHAQTSEVTPLGELTSLLREFTKLVSPTATDLNRLYRNVRRNNDVLVDEAAAVAVKDVLKRDLGLEALAWWNAHVDEVIVHWASANSGLSDGLVKLQYEGIEKPPPSNRWLGYLKTAGGIAIAIPLIIASEVARSPIDFSPGLAGDLFSSASSDANGNRARNILAFRNLVKEAYAESCPGILSPTAPNP